MHRLEMYPHLSCIWGGSSHSCTQGTSHYLYLSLNDLTAAHKYPYLHPEFVMLHYVYARLEVSRLPAVRGGQRACSGPEGHHGAHREAVQELRRRRPPLRHRRPPAPDLRPRTGAQIWPHRRDPGARHSFLHIWRIYGLQQLFCMRSETRLESVLPFLRQLTAQLCPGCMKPVDAGSFLGISCRVLGNGTMTAKLVS